MDNQRETVPLMGKMVNLHEKNSLLSDRLVTAQKENERLHRKIDDIADKYAHLAAKWEKLANPIIDNIGGPKLEWGNEYPTVTVRYLGLIVNAPVDGWIAVDADGWIYATSDMGEPARLPSCWSAVRCDSLGIADLGDLDWTETLRKVSDLEVVV